ncbi:cytochrome bd-I oxidase subunit CydX [Dokdonella sp.]
METRHLGQFRGVPGVGLACSFAILNALWFELNADDSSKEIADENTRPH